MLAYYPHEDAAERVVWYGGESTQLHYEILFISHDGSSEWVENNVQTLGGGIPTSTKDLLAAMSDFYQSMVADRAPMPF